MKLEEALIQLDEEELFGKEHSISIEQSEIMKNFGTLANMIQEAIDGLKERDRLIYEDAEELSKIQMECMELIGEMLGKIKKYM